MTIELEQDFFKVFEIEPKVKCDIIKTANMCTFFACPHYKNIDGDTGECQNLKYPEITDRKLLEMICILGNGKDGSKNLNLYTANEDEWFAVLKDQYDLAYCAAIDKDFKNAVLKLCIYRVDINDFRHQIQQLFKDEE